MSREVDSVRFLEHRAELARKGRLRCRIVSDSMDPVIRVGDFITIEEMPETAALRRFDLLVFLNGDRLFCHFFWAKNTFPGQAPVCTRSIKNPCYSDVPIRSDDILGRVVDRKIPVLTRWKILLKNLVRRTT